MRYDEVSLIEKELIYKCPSLYDYFKIIKDFCIENWERQKCVHYTNHDIQHTLKILSYIHDLIKYCVPPLNPDEIYVLLGSAYLHDISMQFPELLIEKDLSSLNYNDWEKIRDSHRKILKQIINEKLFDFFNEKSDYKHFPYHSHMERICAKHNASNTGTDFLETTKVIGGENIRIRLLLALIQCADALHISPDRNNFNADDSLPLPSKKYWWKNYYVREILFDERCMRLIPHYVIPESFLERMDVFLEFAEYNFKGFHGDALDVLWDHGIRLKVGRFEPWVLIDDRKKNMPNEVVKDIKSFLEKITDKTKRTARSAFDTVYKQRSYRILEAIKFAQKITFAKLNHQLPEISKKRLEYYCHLLMDEGLINLDIEDDNYTYYSCAKKEDT